LPRRRPPGTRCRGRRGPSSAPYHPLHPPLSDRAEDDARRTTGHSSASELMMSNLN
jgi:hypothetical protein